MLTGTGQNPDMWCQKIEEELQRTCLGTKYTYLGCFGDPYESAGEPMLLNVDALDGDDNWKRVSLEGIKLIFRLTGWQNMAPSPMVDDGRRCVARAISNSMCEGRITIANGAHCGVRAWDDTPEFVSDM